MEKIEFELKDFETALHNCLILCVSGTDFKCDPEDSIKKTIERAIEKGYIKKSSLEMASKEFHNKHAFNSDPKHNTSIETYNYITELKKEIERLKKPVEKPIGLKSCDNCRYEKIPAHGHPCGRCRNYEGWEPKQ